MKIKLGILNFSSILGVLLVTISLWGNTLYFQDIAEIQHTSLIIDTTDIKVKISKNFVDIREPINKNYNKHVRDFRFSE